MKKAVIGILIGVGVLAAAAGAALYFSYSEEIKEDTVSFGAVSELSVDTTSTDIIVKKGETNQVHYHVTESLVPDLKEDGGKLTVTSKQKGWKLFRFDLRKCYIEITLTEEALKNLEIDSTSGDITVTGTESGDFSIHSTSGDLHIENCTFGKITSEQTSGDTNIKNVKTESISIKSTSGDISSSDLDANQVKINATSGDIQLRLAGEKDSYNFNLSCTSGDIKVGNNISGGSMYKDIDADKRDRLIEIKTTSGDINLSFAS